MRKFTAITFACFLLTLVLYEGTAAAGYALFGSATASDVISNFPDGWAPAVVARVALTLLLLFSYPLAFHALRSNTTALLPPRWAGIITHGTRHAEGDGKYEPLQDDGHGGAVAPAAAPVEPHATLRERAASALLMWPYALLTALLVALTVGISIALPQISVILGYKGALLGSCIVFIFPGLMHFSLVQKQRRRGKGLLAADGAGADGGLASMSLAAGGDASNSAVAVSSAAGVWNVHDLLTTTHGLIAVGFVAWGLCMMVLGTASTAGAFD
jgi:amino acid permease